MTKRKPPKTDPDAVVEPEKLSDGPESDEGTATPDPAEEAPADAPATPRGRSLAERRR